MAITVERLKAEIEADPARAIAGLTAFDTALTASTRDRTVNIDVDKGRGFDDIFALGAGGTLSLITDGLKSIETAGSGAAKGLTEVADAGGSAGGGLAEAGKGASGAAGGFSSLSFSLPGLLVSLASLLPMMLLWGSILTMLPGALAMVGAAVGALAAAIAPLIGLVGALVPLFGALMLGIGAIAAVAMPLIGAYQAMGAAEKASGAAAEDMAAKHQALEAALHGVKMATEQLADARKELAKAPHEAAEAIEDAHFRAAEAILAEKRAVLALSDAQKNLSDMQNEIARSGLKVTQQTDEFTGKIYDVAVSSEDASVKANDLRKAQLDVADAELQVKEARDRSSDAQATLTEMEKKGIKNSDIMVRARRRVRDAEYSLKQAHQQLTNAQKALTKSATAGTAAQTALADAMAKLTPAGQDFVKFLKNEFAPTLGDLSKAVQDSMIPGLREGFGSILDLMPTIEDGVKKAGKRIGTQFGEFFAYWAKPKNKQTLDDLFGGLANVLGKALKLARPLSRILVSVMDAAKPLVNLLLGDLLTQLDKFADWLETPKGKEDTIHFFKRAHYWLKLWWNVLKPVGRILGRVLDAAKPLAKDILKDLAKHFDGVDKSLKGDGFKTLKRWFNEQKPNIVLFGDILSDVADILFNSTTGGKESAFYKAMKSFQDMLPDIQELFRTIDQTDFASRLIAAIGDLVRIANIVLPGPKPKGPTTPAPPKAQTPSPSGKPTTLGADDVKIDWVGIFQTSWNFRNWAKEHLDVGQWMQDAYNGFLTWWQDDLWPRWVHMNNVTLHNFFTKTLPDWFSDTADSFKKDFLDVIGEHISSAAQTLWDPLKDMFWDAMANIADIWNATIGGMDVNTHLPGVGRITIPEIQVPGKPPPPPRTYESDLVTPPSGPTTSYGDDHRNGRGVTINNIYNEKVDPSHLAREQRRQLVGAGVR